MYENEHDVATTISKFANTNSPMKIHSLNYKHTCLDGTLITCNALSKLAFQLFLWLFY